jgi:hypothetical protein
MKLSAIALASVTLAGACHGDSKPAASAKPAEAARAAPPPAAPAPKPAPTPAPAAATDGRALAPDDLFAGSLPLRLSANAGPVEVTMLRDDDDEGTTRLVAKGPSGVVELDRMDAHDRVWFRFALVAVPDGIVWGRWSDYYKSMSIAHFRFDAATGAFKRDGDADEVAARDALPAWTPAQIAAVLGPSPHAGPVQQLVKGMVGASDHLTWKSPSGAAWTLTVEGTDDGDKKLVATHDDKRDVLVDPNDMTWISGEVALAGDGVVFRLVSPSSHSGIERAYRLAWNPNKGTLTVVAKEDWDRL